MPSATECRLTDGASVQLRRLTGQDYDAVIRMSETLTDRERYLRFFQAHPGFLDEWARSLTGRSETLVAIGAFEADELVGVANYAELETAGCAEIAVVVAHEQHERGVGTALLQELGRMAAAHGARHLVADVLAENYLMQRVITDAACRANVISTARPSTSTSISPGCPEISS